MSFTEEIAKNNPLVEKPSRPYVELRNRPVRKRRKGTKKARSVWHTYHNNGTRK